MQQNSPVTPSDLLLETAKLRCELEQLKREKFDLEILLETTIVHADLVEAQLHESNLQLELEVRERKATEAKLKASEIQLNSLLETITQANYDLKIILETTTVHGDFIEEYTHNLSIRDPLTGLFNRHYQEKSLERHLKYAQEYGQNLSIIMGDIDYFKNFNDQWGHQAGDVVLQEISKFLIYNIRQSDIACRYGGEELMLILPGTSLEEAKNLAKQLNLGIQRLSLDKPEKFLQKVTVSLGVASFPEHGLSSLEITQSADAALYRAKAKGRDCVITASELLL